MEYKLFLDESGDHGLTTINKDFPVFVLCGVLISIKEYNKLIKNINKLKEKYWGKKKVILHSRDIRKHEKEFVILFDMEIKKNFYYDLNKIIQESNYQIISSGIDKIKYVKRYGRLVDDVYEVGFSFVMERTIFALDNLKDKNINLDIMIEKRGKKEDNELKNHFNTLLQRGTYYVSSNRFKKYITNIDFKSKYKDIQGLQLSDLLAYPIARYVIDKKRANPSFEILKNKFYKRGDRLYGLKIFP